MQLKNAHGEWVIEEAEEKLAFRASLPGAFGYDQAAHLYRSLQAEGLPALALLPSVFPTTWLVNSRATSHAFRAWLVPPARSLWESLLAQLPATMSLDEWTAVEPEDRDAIASNVARLASIEGAGLSAISKVLGLLRPQLVPLMDDAAVAFAIGAVAAPDKEQATAGPEVFVPMLDWFAEQTITNEQELIKLAANHKLAVLDAPQVLDRLLWMDAWGERYRRASRSAGS